VVGVIILSTTGISTRGPDATLLPLFPRVRATTLIAPRARARTAIVPALWLDLDFLPIFIQTSVGVCEQIPKL